MKEKARNKVIEQVQISEIRLFGVLMLHRTTVAYRV